MVANNKTLPSDLPLVLGVDVIDRLARYDRSDFAADYAIGNQPWMSMASDTNRISRITTAYQKERVDQEASAGENSLSNWWLRSATSWHRGAGVLFYDGDAGDQFRFGSSANIDVWTQGQFTLLKDTEEIRSSGATHVETCDTGFWFVDSARDLFHYAYATGTVTSITSVTSDVYDIATDGQNILAATANGVWEVSESTLSGTKIYNAPGSSWTPHHIELVKSRIMVAAQVTDTFPYRVFELGRNPATPPTNISINTDSRYETKSVITFSAITETTGAILVAINTGNRSKVLSFTVDNSAAGNAALLEPIIVAEFPSGELVNELRGYLSTYVVAATTKGLRVAEETANGLGFTYGPLTLKGDVKDISFNGEYIYATRETEYLGVKGLWRIHLGTTVDSAYAYAADLSIPAGTPVAATVLGTTGRMVIATSSKIYAEHATRLAATGYVNSGWIRFGTTEYKQPVSFAVHSGTAYGTLGITVQSNDGDSITFESIPQDQVLNIPLSANMLPDTQFEVVVTLTRDSSDTAKGPMVEEWQLRSLPAPLRSRTITIPLMCYSEERDSLGNVRSSDPWPRLRALEKLEQSGGACLFQDFTTGEERICVVRAIQYDQSAPPSFTEGFGGMVTVQLQTIDVEVT
jgi:hypothetical protein